MPSETSSTVTIPKEETVINPSSNGIIMPTIPVNVITSTLPSELSGITISEEDDMNVIIEEVVNKVVNKAVEKMNDNFIMLIDKIYTELKKLQVDASFQSVYNTELNTRLTYLENKKDSTIDVDTCTLNKIKGLLLSFINKK